MAEFNRYGRDDRKNNSNDRNSGGGGGFKPRTFDNDRNSGGGGFNQSRAFKAPFDRENKGYNDGSSTYKKEIDNQRTRIYTKNNLQPDQDAPKPDTYPMRLNRFIANTGVCSRRKADELITAGKIQVNGEVITTMGYKVEKTDIVIHNEKQLTPEKLVYVLLNKPKDFITTTDDPQERRTVMNLIENAAEERLFPVGRLDRATTGLLLLTNDGDLTMRLTHPSNEIAKIYHVVLDKPLAKNDLDAIAAGLELEDGKADVDEIAYTDEIKRNEIGISIHIGKNRIVRRIFEHLGYEVEKLDRVTYAGLTKKDLPRGNWRYLSSKEIGMLKYAKKIEVF